jgi:hypothetical protein
VSPRVSGGGRGEGEERGKMGVASPSFRSLPPPSAPAPHCATPPGGLSPRPNNQSRASVRHPPPARCGERSRRLRRRSTKSKDAGPALHRGGTRGARGRPCLRGHVQVQLHDRVLPGRGAGLLPDGERARRGAGISAVGRRSPRPSLHRALLALPLRRCCAAPASTARSLASARPPTPTPACAPAAPSSRMCVGTSEERGGGERTWDILRAHRAASHARSSRPRPLSPHPFTGVRQGVPRDE